MHGYIFYTEMFFIALFLSTLFALGGIGFAVAFVPILSFFGLDFNAAKAIGLFLNSVSTGIGSFRNWRKKVLDIKFALILTIPALIGAVIGSYLSKYVPVHIVKILFACFLVFSVIMLLWKKRKKEFKLEHNETLVGIIALSVGTLSGLLGVGGGAILVPLLVLIGFDAKYVARNISFVIAVSTFGGFLTYISFIKLDWILLIITTIASLLGGWLGNYLMNEKLNQKHIRIVLAILLLIIAGKLIWKLL